MEAPIVFTSRKGASLFGMAFEPDSCLEERTGILFCVSSLKYRVGPSRMYTLLARDICALGYHVMYFDPSGIGDSEGILEQKKLTEHHLDIQKGSLRDDIHDAVTIFISRYGLDNVVLFGLCGGAVSAIIAGADDTRVKGLILLAVPILYDLEEKKGEAADQAYLIASEAGAKDFISSAMKKIFQGETWKRIGKIHWRLELKMLDRALSLLVLRMLQRLGSGRADAVAADRAVSAHPRFNQDFQRSFFAFVARAGRIQFVFAGNDLITTVFRLEFQEKVLVKGSPYASLCGVKVIEGANHIFSGHHTRKEVLEVVSSWLSTHFPLSAAATVRRS